MKKQFIFLLIVTMIFSSSIGFAERGPREEGSSTTLDQRVQLFYQDEGMPGDVKYFDDGAVVVETFSDKMQEYLLRLVKLTSEGEILENQTVPYDLEGMAIPHMVNVLFEDVAGNFYTKNGDGLFCVSPQFEVTDIALDEPLFWCNIETMDDVMINHIRFENTGDSSFAASTYQEGDVPTDYDRYASIEDEVLLTQMKLAGGSISGVVFGDQADEIYVLAIELNDKDETSMQWKVGRFSMNLVAGDEGEFNMALILKDLITLKDVPENSIAYTFAYDGRGFQVPFVSMEENLSTLARFDKYGNRKDSIQVLGKVLHIDTHSNQAVFSAVTFAGDDSGCYYRVNWGPLSTDGVPRSLIQERSMNGKTTANFRDGGYGLLRSSEDEMGVFHYLAPLRTKEKEVRLRIPLADVVAKLGGTSRNLEILYGNNRITIPMTALAVQDLLAQMPFETDATVEIHLVRGEDGSVSVTAELFVVEQVDEMTKLLHRLPIVLP